MLRNIAPGLENAEWLPLEMYWVGSRESASEGRAFKLGSGIIKRESTMSCVPLQFETLTWPSGSCYRLIISEARQRL